MTDEANCEHQWVVYSTALKEVVLMVECCKCGAKGIVERPTIDEWTRDRPHPWTDNQRVKLIPRKA